MSAVRAQSQSRFANARGLALMAAKEFAFRADDHVAASLAYLRAQQPVHKALPTVAFGSAFPAALALGRFRLRTTRSIMPV